MKQYDILSGGYISVDRIIKVRSPLKVGFTSIIENKDNAQVYYGGCSANITYHLARLGMKSVPYIRVGDDPERERFFDYFRSAGVCVDAIRTVPGETTSNCYLFEDEENNHVTVYYPGAMAAKYAQPMEDKWFLDSRLGVMTVGSYPDNQEFLNRCRKNQLPMVFGMKSDFDAFPKDFLKEVLLYSRIIFANNAERETIEHLYQLNSITDLFEVGQAEIILITLGSRGSICYEKTEDGFQMSEIRVARCGNVVDTTGSGDAYMSGFLYGYLNGYDPVESCNMGSVLSSFIVEAMGCLTSAPSKEQFMQRYKEFHENKR